MMVYAYYESILHKIANDSGTIDRPSEICKRKGATLSRDATKAAETLFSEARLLRNYLCHNDAGTDNNNNPEQTKRILETLSKRGDIDMHIVRLKIDSEQIEPGNNTIDITKSQLYSVNSNYTLDILRKEYLVLKELSLICGYAHQIIK